MEEFRSSVVVAAAGGVAVVVAVVFRNDLAAWLEVRNSPGRVAFPGQGGHPAESCGNVPAKRKLNRGKLCNCLVGDEDDGLAVAEVGQRKSKCARCRVYESANCSAPAEEDEEGRVEFVAQIESCERTQQALGLAVRRRAAWRGGM